MTQAQDALSAITAVTSTRAELIIAESRLVGSGTGSLSSSEQRRSRGTLDSVIDAIEEDPSVSIDALGGIVDMVAFWKGMCEISLTVQPELLSTVDAEAAESVLIVTSEMISNAIRHGSATSMSIEIHRDSPETIRVHAVNNGRGLGDEHRPGLGMSLYDELSTEWQIPPGEPVTVVAPSSRHAGIDSTQRRWERVDTHERHHDNNCI